MEHFYFRKILYLDLVLAGCMLDAELGNDVIDWHCSLE